jgi:hypothetical protein
MDTILNHLHESRQGAYEWPGEKLMNIFTAKFMLDMYFLTLKISLLNYAVQFHPHKVSGIEACLDRDRACF